MHIQEIEIYAHPKRHLRIYAHPKRHLRIYAHPRIWGFMHEGVLSPSSPPRLQRKGWIAHEDEVHHRRHDERTHQNVVVHVGGGQCEEVPVLKLFRDGPIWGGVPVKPPKGWGGFFLQTPKIAGCPFGLPLEPQKTSKKDALIQASSSTPRETKRSASTRGVGSPNPKLFEQLVFEQNQLILGVSKVSVGFNIINNMNPCSRTRLSWPRWTLGASQQACVNFASPDIPPCLTSSRKRPHWASLMF